jgi:hypothetical protein
MVRLFNKETLYHQLIHKIKEMFCKTAQLPQTQIFESLVELPDAFGNQFESLDSNIDLPPPQNEDILSDFDFSQMEDDFGNEIILDFGSSTEIQRIQNVESFQSEINTQNILDVGSFVNFHSKGEIWAGKIIELDLIDSKSKIEWNQYPGVDWVDEWCSLDFTFSIYDFNISLDSSPTKKKKDSSIIYSKSVYFEDSILFLSKYGDLFQIQHNLCRYIHSIPKLTHFEIIFEHNYHTLFGVSLVGGDFIKIEKFNLIDDKLTINILHDRNSFPNTKFLFSVNSKLFSVESEGIYELLKMECKKNTKGYTILNAASFAQMKFQFSISDEIFFIDDKNNIKRYSPDHKLKFKKEKLKNNIQIDVLFQNHDHLFILSGSKIYELIYFENKFEIKDLEIDLLITPTLIISIVAGDSNNFSFIWKDNQGTHFNSIQTPTTNLE